MQRHHPFHPIQFLIDKSESAGRAIGKSARRFQGSPHGRSLGRKRSLLLIMQAAMLGIFFAAALPLFRAGASCSGVQFARFLLVTISLVAIRIYMPFRWQHHEPPRSRKLLTPVSISRPRLLKQ